MAILDKLNSLAKSATDIANETIEITRLNAQIGTQQNKIAGLKNRLGEHVWLRFQEGEQPDETAAELCREIADIVTDIENKRAQVQALKGASQQQEAASVAADASGCPTCGVANPDGVKFCRECGAKLEPTPTHCPTCGTENPSGTRFCGECGTRLD